MRKKCNYVIKRKYLKLRLHASKFMPFVEILFGNISRNKRIVKWCDSIPACSASKSVQTLTSELLFHFFLFLLFVCCLFLTLNAWSACVFGVQEKCVAFIHTYIVNNSAAVSIWDERQQLYWFWEILLAMPNSITWISAVPFPSLCVQLHFVPIYIYI